MNKKLTSFYSRAITPYLVVMVLTFIISWFVFRDKDDSTQVKEANDMAVTKIQAIGKMELVKLTIKDVLEYTIERDYLPDSKVLLVVSGEMAGCIDLTKIRQDQISVKDSILKITLPNDVTNGNLVCFEHLDNPKNS